MSKIKDFYIVCRNCPNKDFCNVAWHEKKALIFTCLECGNVELIKLKDSQPMTREELEEQLKND